MSLSFVSKSIQTTREDGGFDEKEIANSSETSGGTAVTGGGKPLFEQLRQNKEQEDAEREELQRSMMRGTLALDEDDAAHLEQLNQQRVQRESEKHQQTQQELASFRAAQADRFEKQHQRNDNDDGNRKEEAVVFDKTQKPAKKPAFGPTILKKRKRRPDETQAEKPSNVDKTVTKKDDKQESSVEPKGETSGALSSLLTGYSSSSDEEE